MELLLAADLGTTAVKAMVIGAGGAVVAEASQEVALQYPEPGFVELPLDPYWGGVRGRGSPLHHSAGARRLADRGARAVGPGRDARSLRRRRHAVDERDRWLDNRAAEETRSLRNEFSDEECYARTGQVSFVPTWPAAKLLWLRRHRQEVFRGP